MRVAVLLSSLVALGLTLPARAQSGLTTVCQFTSGPRAGSTFDFRPYGVQPIPVGSPCTDGQSSTGIAVAGGRGTPSNGPAPSSGGMTTVCQFNAGPKAGSTVDFKPYGVQPIPVGAPCTDGQNSTGVAIAASSSGASTTAAAPTPPMATPRPAATDWESCRNACNTTKDQCVQNCGPGPDRVNNPNWLSCRSSCRQNGHDCRSACSSNDSGSDSP
jgi:hypothetical protein